MAKDKQESMTGPRAYAPHLVDSRRQCTAKCFRYERTIYLRERCTRKGLCRIADFAAATSEVDTRPMGAAQMTHLSSLRI